MRLYLSSEEAKHILKLLAKDFGISEFGVRNTEIQLIERICKCLYLQKPHEEVHNPPDETRR